MAEILAPIVGALSDAGAIASALLHLARFNVFLSKFLSVNPVLN